MVADVRSCFSIPLILRMPVLALVSINARFLRLQELHGSWQSHKLEVMNMKCFAIPTVFAAALAASGCSESSQSSASTGPNGGDLVPIRAGANYAELLANADAGEVMVYTWDEDLKSPQPLNSEPIILGSGDKSVELTPHPMDTDPAGRCSRFYGRTDWIRGGDIRNGWMHGGEIGDHVEFVWQHCWEAGRKHGQMWEEMGRHHHLGGGHGPGHRGGSMDH